LALLAVAVVAATVGIVAHATGILAGTERATVDARFTVRGSQRAPPGIVIVGIDQDSLARLPRFPFQRSLYARVIDRLRRDRARLIAFDIEFNRPTTAAQDDALIDAAQRARPVVFATTLIDRSGRTEVLGGALIRRQIGARAGATAALPDSSGVIRRLPYSVNGLPSFSVVIAALRRGRPVDRAAFTHGGALIDYLGPSGTFRTISFVDVLRGRAPAAAFRNRVVIVGETAPSGQDLHPSPLGVLPGAEVQANALATILAGYPLHQVSGWLSASLIVALAAIVPLASAARRALVTLAAAGAALVALAVGAQLAFDAGRIIDVSDSLLVLGLASAATIAVEYALQDRERRRLRELFAAFAPDVVAQVLAQPSTAPRSGRVALSATRVIGGYRMEDVIGRGAMGVVYRATQLALARPVAVKLISPDHATNPVFRERFERESRLAASVEHANVIPVYEAGEDDGLLFIAMRYVDGVDLGVLVERLGPLTPQRAATIVAAVAGALDAAHERGLVHRDVKPANILLTDDHSEHAYLTDFGVAKITTSEDTAMTSPGQWVGTVDYIAPEQLHGDTPTGSADIYALGGVLHYALTGYVPYPLESDVAKLLAHVGSPPPTPSTHDPALAAFDPVVARAMAKEPPDRFATAAQLGIAAGKAAQAAEAI
jgi:CHASE2 domain-containing sensor protein/predicted Ser/Thr protein kinase